MSNFNKIFRKNVTNDDVKSHRIMGLHPLSRKNRREVALTSSAFLRSNENDILVFNSVFVFVLVVESAHLLDSDKL